MTLIESGGADGAGGRPRAGEDGPAGAAPELGLQVRPEREPEPRGRVAGGSGRRSSHTPALRFCNVETVFEGSSRVTSTTIKEIIN